MTKKQYGDYQFDIYFDGLEGQTPNYPVDYAVLERAAAEVLPPWVLSYVAGGAGDESTQRGNVEAFSRYGIMPRMFVGATERDLSVSLFDMRLPTPLFYALAVGGTDAVVSQLRAARRTGPDYGHRRISEHRGSAGRRCDPAGHLAFGSSSRGPTKVTTMDEAFSAPGMEEGTGSARPAGGAELERFFELSPNCSASAAAGTCGG